MPNARITHVATFCAALRLHQPDRSESWNQETYGVCYSRNFHGHNYELEVTLEGPVDPDTGMVMDFLRLQSLVKRRIVDSVDHRNLNLDVPFLQGRIPTTENLAVSFWERLATEIPPPIKLFRLRLRESAEHWVSYEGPEAQA